MKPHISAILTASAALVLTICFNAAALCADFTPDKDISVVSREDGSGTRGAFVELFAITAATPSGGKKDLTTKEAIIANKTDVMMLNIANDPYAIGYISLGSLNNSIKALEIDGVKAAPENVRNGSYPIVRPFVIATKGEPTGLANDFISFILSGDGQKVVAGAYIPVKDDAPPYAGGKRSGKITVAGSSSVAPVMEKLKEAYIARNSGAVIEIQMSDSTAGMSGAINGTCDIGMSSRNLKDSEKAKLRETAIAHDGIAVIVNNANPLANVSGGQVKSIFTGAVVKWSDVK